MIELHGKVPIPPVDTLSHGVVTRWTMEVSTEDLHLDELINYAIDVGEEAVERAAVAELRAGDMSDVLLAHAGRVEACARIIRDRHPAISGQLCAIASSMRCVAKPLAPTLTVEIGGAA